MCSVNFSGSSVPSRGYIKVLLARALALNRESLFSGYRMANDDQGVLWASVEHL